jgi:hypothetical protein
MGAGRPAKENEKGEPGAEAGGRERRARSARSDKERMKSRRREKYYPTPHHGREGGQ